MVAMESLLPIWLRADLNRAVEWSQLRCQRGRRQEDRMRTKVAVAVLLIVAVAWALGPAGAQQGKIELQNLDALGKVDLILVTHAHGDHIGDTPDLAKKHNVP